MERSLRSHLETAINDYRSGATIEACLQTSPEAIHPYLRVFDQLALAQEPLDRGQLRTSLRRRFVSGALSELRSTGATGSRMGRVAAAAATAFIVGAAINPALADELVHQVARTFGSAVSSTLSQVFEDGRGASADAAARSQPAATEEDLVPLLESSASPVLPIAPPSATDDPGNPASASNTGGGGEIADGAPPIVDHPVVPTAMPPDPTTSAPSGPNPATSGGSSVGTPAVAVPSPGGDGTLPVASGPTTELPLPDSPVAPLEADEATGPPAYGLAHSNGRGDDLPGQANGGNRDVALADAADSGNKLGQPGTVGNAGDPPGLAAGSDAGNGVSQSGSPGNAATAPGLVEAAGDDAQSIIPIDPAGNPQTGPNAKGASPAGADGSGDVPGPIGGNASDAAAESNGPAAGAGVSSASANPAGGSGSAAADPPGQANKGK